MNERYNMRGRAKFNKHKWLLKMAQGFFCVFPKKARENLLVHYRGKKGIIGIALRYCLLKTLAKSVGDNVAIYPDVYLFKVDKLSIGDNVSIHPMCYIDACGEISISNDVSIAHDVSIISFNHKYSDLTVPIKDQALEKKPIRIENDVWIGAKAVILSGVTVKQGSVIGAASVVTHDVQERSVVVGSPARVIKRRGEIDGD